MGTISIVLGILATLSAFVMYIGGAVSIALTLLGFYYGVKGFVGKKSVISTSTSLVGIIVCCVPLAICVIWGISELEDFMSAAMVSLIIALTVMLPFLAIRNILAFFQNGGYKEKRKIF